MKRLLLTIWLMCIPSALAAEQPPKTWVVYYTDQAPWQQFENYDLIVFDSDHHPAIRPLQGRGKDVIAYLSLTEVGEYRTYFGKLKKQRLLLGEKADGGRPIVDIRDPGWLKLIIEEIIPYIVRKGFDGVMLDTLDTAIDLEPKYPGMKDALTAIIQQIRMHYPYLKIMVNRGFEVLPDVVADVDMVLAESVYVDAREEPYKPFPDEHYTSVTEMFAALKEASPHLTVYSLDYWDMEDKEGIKEIYQKQRDAGYIPYVASPDLQDAHEEHR